ncbi:MAG: hypothetical protein GX467_00480 [Rikenellaceae bacterium]|jgi:hypothetical protein|nr:hypothetical protein [Rikenellaceae bacterium]
MKVGEAIQALTNYPIPKGTIDLVCAKRGLVSTAEVSFNRSFNLAKADIYLWLSKAPNIREQEVTISFTEAERNALKRDANSIYDEYGEGGGGKVGYVGENFNSI